MTGSAPPHSGADGLIADALVAGQGRAMRLVFLCAGLGNAAWAALVPFARARSGLGDAGLGLLLLCLGLGSVAAMPVAGALSARFGCRIVMAVATAIVCATLPPLAVLSGRGALMIALASFGAGLGALDVAMNMQAIRVERVAARPLMSGFHARFSLGGIVGAGGMAMLLRAGLPPLLAAACMSLVILALLAAALPALPARPNGEPDAGPGFAVPRGVVLLIGALCSAVFLAEGAVLDWSGVLLSTARGMGADLAGLGYATFAAAMTVGRLGGDRVVAAIGYRRVLPLGALCAAAGFALSALVPVAVAGLVGFALVGLGLANIVPVLFSAAGRQRAMPESAAVPAISTLGYAGMLAGPASIGVLSGLLGLPGALLLLAALLLLVAVAGRGV